MFISGLRCDGPTGREELPSESAAHLQETSTCTRRRGQRLSRDRHVGAAKTGTRTSQPSGAAQSRGSPAAPCEISVGCAPGGKVDGFRCFALNHACDFL
ncbi:hypothetical protein LSAT2_015919 [Lamellibrachia satsuma]|nr:hypothetical protein LSAT2_015919 [Lamellibrachia satsuma]